MQTLRVYPNPWAAFDKNGVPCAVCPRDPDADAGGPGQFVGARIDRKNTKVLEDFAAGYVAKFGSALAKRIAEQEHRSPRQATFYQYLGIESFDQQLAEKLAAKEPVEIPATKYYKDRIREGALIAADAETAAKCKVPHWMPPAEYFNSRRVVAAPTSSESATEPSAIGAPEFLDAAPADPVSAKPSNRKKTSQESDS